MELARTYATALASLASTSSLDRLERLVQRLGRLAISLTTQTHYSLCHLTVIDAVVLAAVELSRRLSGTAGPTNTEHRTET